MSHILIVGQKLYSLSNYLSENGYSYTYFQDILKTKFPDKRFKNRVVVDFSDNDNLIKSLRKVKVPIDGVITTYENYVVPVAVIASHLSLPGMPVDVAEACTDKFIMRSKFDQAPEKISPAFANVNNELDVRLFADKHQFPLILKPANLAKSLLVTKNLSLDDLLNSYRHSLELLGTIYKKYAPNRTPKLIIEEFLEGSIHSVDAFVDTDGEPHILDAIVDYQTGYDIGYDDNFHYSRLLPSKLTLKDQEALRHVAAVGIKALGMRSSPAHVEIIMTANGPRIVEIGARNGGYRERMHALANGVDITHNALATSLGRPVDISIKHDHPCAVLELFPKTPGVFVGVEGIKVLRTLPSLNYIDIKVKRGQFVGKAADGHKMCAVVILYNRDLKQFEKDIAYVNDHVRITTAYTNEAK